MSSSLTLGVAAISAFIPLLSVRRAVISKRTKAAVVIGTVLTCWTISLLTVSLLVVSAVRLDDPLAQLILDKPNLSSLLAPARALTGFISSYWWVSFLVAVPSVAAVLAVPVTHLALRLVGSRKLRHPNAA